MVNFTFVTHKGARPERSELVKSHVMRESQRRRREAKQRLNHTTAARAQHFVPTTTNPSNEQDSQLDFQVQSSVARYASSNSGISTGASHGQSTYLTTFDNSSSLSWTSTSGFSSPLNSGSLDATPNQIHSSWAGSQDLFLAPSGETQFPQWPPSADIQEDVINFETAFGQHNAINLFHNNESELLPTLTPQPSLLYPTFVGDNSTLDVSFVSQPLFDRVTELVSHYTASLEVERPGHPPFNAGAYWYQVALASPKILLSCALFYCAYRDTIRDMAGTDHHYFKDRVIRMINGALEDPNTAVTEENIAAVISMCMYENIRGSDVIVTHLQGLRQMIDMRGGINNLPRDEGQNIMEMSILQDALHSCCSNTAPFMFDISGPTLRDTRTTAFESFYPQSPLRVVNDAGFARPPVELQSSFEILKDAFDAFEMLCIEAFDADTAVDEVDFFKVRREKFWARLMRVEQDGVKELPPTPKKRVEEAVRLAAKIHFRACVYRIQHDDEANVEDMKRLHTIIRKIDLRFWKVAYYVFLWILMTGGAAAHRHPEQRPYFVSEFMRLGLSIGLFDWRPFRQTLGNFLWLQLFLRRNNASESGSGAG